MDLSKFPRLSKKFHYYCIRRQSNFKQEWSESWKGKRLTSVLALIIISWIDLVQDTGLPPMILKANSAVEKSAEQLEIISSIVID